ncbi:MAG TPA: hypothetical protein GX516_01995 [Thermoanaerobacter sp.]|nr:hypothetical protein [Thermoanaerobacter sp.]
MKQNRNKKLPQNRLILTRQFSLGLNMLPQFKEAMLAATRIWNSCVWHSRNIHKEEKRWPTNAELIGSPTPEGVGRKSLIPYIFLISLKNGIFSHLSATVAV